MRGERSSRVGRAWPAHTDGYLDNPSSGDSPFLQVLRGGMDTALPSRPPWYPDVDTG
jgi:hypothetical protein